MRDPWTAQTYGAGIGLGLVNDEPWMTDALCAQIGGDHWHPGKGEPATEARRICNICPVAAQCLDYGIRIDDRHAVMGGLTARQRMRMAKKRGRVA